MLFDPNWAPPPSEIKLKPWQQLLLKAADIIEQKGWCRNDYTSRGRHCMLGALMRADGKDGTMRNIPSRTMDAAMRRVEKYLNKDNVLYPYLFSIVRWNDEYAKNSKEVIAILRKTASL